MSIALVIALYFVTGFCLSVVIRSLMFDRSVAKKLDKLDEYIEKYPSTHYKESKFTEKERIQWAIKEASDIDQADWIAMSILTFFFWPFIAPVFFIKRAFDHFISGKIKMLSISKYEQKLHKLDEIEVLKTQAAEDKKKYQEALQLLKAEGINVGE